CAFNALKVAPCGSAWAIASHSPRAISSPMCAQSDRERSRSAMQCPRVHSLLLSLATFYEIGEICHVLDDLAVLKAEDVAAVAEARRAKPRTRELLRPGSNECLLRVRALSRSRDSPLRGVAIIGRLS